MRENKTILDTIFFSFFLSQKQTRITTYYCKTTKMMIKLLGKLHTTVDTKKRCCLLDPQKSCCMQLLSAACNTTTVRIQYQYDSRKRKKVEGRIKSCLQPTLAFPPSVSHNQQSQQYSGCMQREKKPHHGTTLFFCLFEKTTSRGLVAFMDVLPAFSPNLSCYRVVYKFFKLAWTPCTSPL